MALLLTVHPHACGEYEPGGNLLKRPTGSSPRVWGIPLVGASPYARWRFIPTRVGNTTSSSTATGCSAVHPHACGEYSGISLMLVGSRGSSPRVWGILAGARKADGVHRFIPTRVGNTSLAVATPETWPVHPHACGEYAQGRCPDSVQGGSSPRVWGIPLHRIGSALGSRFIPTRVGNTRQNRR